MDLTLPGRVVSSTATAATLEVLAGAEGPFTGRQIARLVRAGSAQAVLDVLHRLVEHGLVQRQIIGRTHLYQLNEEHLATPVVRTLSNMHGELVERLRAGMRTWDVKPRHASLFGSAARRDGTPRSDLDILLIRRKATKPDHVKWIDQKEALANKAVAWSGNRISWLDLSQADVTQALRKGDPLVDEWKRDRVHLAGTVLRSMLQELA